MIAITCDGCGARLVRGALRYTVSIDVKAAYDDIEVRLIDLVRDHRDELLALIERLKDKDPKKIEETVYKRMELDLCPKCQRVFIQSPLRFHPEGQAGHLPVDIDAFLHSLGYGRPSDQESSENT